LKDKNIRMGPNILISAKSKNDIYYKCGSRFLFSMLIALILKEAGAVSYDDCIQKANGDLVIDSGDLIIDGGGIVIDGGDTVIDGGDIVIDGGGTVIDGGGIVIDGGGIVIDGGDTVIDDGDTVIDGGDIVIDGGDTVFDSGGIVFKTIAKMKVTGYIMRCATHLLLPKRKF